MKAQDIKIPREMHPEYRSRATDGQFGLTEHLRLATSRARSADADRTAESDDFWGQTTWTGKHFDRITVMCTYDDLADEDFVSRLQTSIAHRLRAPGGVHLVVLFDSPEGT